MRIVKWIGWGLGALVALVFAAVLGLIAVDRMGRPPAPDLKALVAKAQRYDVRIRRDEWGVPHILGKTDADAAFGLAYAHAEDDFATIQDVALATRGTLAATDGPKAAVTDYIVQLLGVWPTVNARYDRDMPADVKAVLDAYADGINAYGAAHPSELKGELLPLTGKDVAAGFVFKTPFFYGLDKTLQHLTAPAKKDDLPKGSNGAAVAPSRSADGATRLLVNSHQPYTGPVAWYEAVVESGQGWHVAGGFFPGAPFMLHGHNAHLGWANTVNNPDLVDVYKLTINPQNPNQYRLDGQWKDFEKSDAALRVKLFGPLVITVHKDVLHSAHGPVLKTDHGVFAVRYAGMGEVRQAAQYYRLDKAGTLAEWKTAMAMQALPSINYLYADEKGDIGYVYNGLFPNRKPGVDWSGVLPGDRSDLIWNGYLPFDKVPQIWNPKSGYVFNSNNTPFEATGPEDALKPQDFAPEMGLQTNMTNRAYRAQENLGADPKVTSDAFRRYKFDLVYSPRSDMAKFVAEALAIDPKGDADVIAAQRILKGWNLSTDIHNRGAALAVLMVRPAIKAQQDGLPNPPIGPGFHAAIRILKEHFGRLDPEWGEVNRIRRGAVDLPIDGGPDTYRAVYGTLEKDGRLAGVAGDTLIMFVQWDKAGRLSSESVHQFGSATQDQRSPHYADQVPLFTAMKTKPVLFTEAQLKGHVREDYQPGRRTAK